MTRADFRRMAAGAPGSSPPRPLDPAADWDSLILAEADLLRKWTGINASLVHVTDGTAACADNTLCVDRAELDRFFAKFSPTDKYRTAIFFALAHEFGHLCQFRAWGVEEALKLGSIEVEAHADYLAGIWLGLRLTQGHQRLTEDVFEAGMQLKSQRDDYPTAYQRGRLLQDAMGQAVMLIHIIEPQMSATRDKMPTRRPTCFAGTRLARWSRGDRSGVRAEDEYSRLEVALSDTDVRDLFETAKSRLEELPKDHSWEKLIKRSVFKGPFRRV